MQLFTASCSSTSRPREDDGLSLPLAAGPPQKKQRTFSPTVVASEWCGDADEELLSEESIEGEDVESLKGSEVDCYTAPSFTELSTEMIFAEYLQSGDINTIHQGLGLLWGRLGGGELASSFTIAIRQQREDILSQGGHWVLTNIMSTHEDDASVHIRCCSILRELLLEGGAARYQVYYASGMDRVIGAMERFSSNVHMQVIGCQFLARLVLSPVSTAILEDIVRSTMGLRTIFQLLENKDTEAEFQEGMVAATNKELFTAATSLLYTLVGQCPFGLRAEILDELQRQRLDSDMSRRLATMLQDYGSLSMREEHYVL